MATITLTILPAALATRVTDAICNGNGYTAIIAETGLPNPQTKAEFVKAWLGRQLKDAVKKYEAQTASNNAFVSASTDAETNITIT